MRATRREQQRKRDHNASRDTSKLSALSSILPQFDLTATPLSPPSFAPPQRPGDELIIHTISSSPSLGRKATKKAPARDSSASVCEDSNRKHLHKQRARAHHRPDSRSPISWRTVTARNGSPNVSSLSSSVVPSFRRKSEQTTAKAPARVIIQLLPFSPPLGRPATARVPVRAATRASACNIIFGDVRSAR